MTLLPNVTAVAIGGRALLIEGPPGSGKSSLALSLIDRGAVLIGDDGVVLDQHGARLQASPPPRITGLLEVRNLGLLAYPTAADVPLALVLRLDAAAPRFIAEAEHVDLCGVAVPMVRVWPGGDALAVKAKLALERFGA